MKKVLYLPMLFLVFGLAIPNTSCSPKYADLMDTLDSRPELGIMHSLVEAAGGPKTFLGKTKEYTVFAVTNEGASHVKASLQKAITDPEHRTELQNILRHATIDGKYSASQLANSSSGVKSLAGNVLEFTGTADNLMVNGVKVIDSIDMGDSIIHVTEEAI